MKFPNQAQCLRDFRAEYGLTQKELSDVVGLESAQFISNMERGVVSIPPSYVKVCLKKFVKCKHEKKIWLNGFHGSYEIDASKIWLAKYLSK